MMTDHARLEALLFYRGEPVSRVHAARTLGLSPEVLEQAISLLDQSLVERGIVLIDTGDEITLGTHPDLAEFIQSLRKDELEMEFSKAALETLAIIAYKGPLAKSDIDYIRGVNSQFILRALLIRGLIEKRGAEKRSPVYGPTPELLAHLGIRSEKDLPSYQDFQQELAAFVSKDISPESHESSS